VKLAAENFFSTYFKSFFPVTHLRLSSVASEGEHPSQLMSNLYESAFNGKKIKINKSSTTHLLYIDEAVDLIISAALLKSTVKLVIAEDGHLNEELAQMFEKVSSKKLNAEYINNIAVNDDRIFISDKDKLARSWVREYHIEAIMKKIIAVNNKHRSLIYD
jgi:nucleoside-diphosphate-sugar epimerase